MKMADGGSMKSGLGIDIGTTGVRLVFVGKENVFFKEAPYLAVDAADGTVLGCGNDAVSLSRRAPGSVYLISPFAAEKKRDFSLLQAYFSHILKEIPVRGCNVFFSYNGEADGDKETLLAEVLKSCRAREIAMVDSHYAALQGAFAGTEGCDHLNAIVMDMGAGSVNIGGYVDGEPAASSLVNEGGLALDFAIAGALYRSHHVRLSGVQAESCKLALGTLLPFGNKSTDIHGVWTSLGLPSDITVDEKEVTGAIEPIFDDWVDAVNMMKRRLTKEPESILLCGGTAALKGLASSLLPLVGIPVQVDRHPDDAVVRGLAAMLSSQK